MSFFSAFHLQLLQSQNDLQFIKTIPEAMNMNLQLRNTVSILESL